MSTFPLTVVRSVTTLAADLESAEAGDERAQLRTLVRSLATQLGLLALVLPESPSRTSTIQLASAALDFLDDPGEPSC